MSIPSSYLLCGTPRTGSTLLCSLLASTGVAGRPESYFREPDQADWAARFGVSVAADGTVNYRDFVDGAVQAGTTPNGIFAARIMWGTMDRVIEGLSQSPSGAHDLDMLSEPLGPLLLVHLRRQDIVAQAVSWARAEQTGYWQQGDACLREPHFDLEQVESLVRTIGEDNAAWTAWFSQQGVRPHVVTYEDLVADPRLAVHGILDCLAVEPPPDWQPNLQHMRQAGEVNEEWVHRFCSLRR